MAWTTAKPAGGVVSDMGGSFDEWGIEFRIAGGQLMHHVPDGYHVAAANHDVIAYVTMIAAELNRLPRRYGFNLHTTYTVLVQTWDRACLSARSLAMGRQKQGHESVGLIPDAYYIGANGYEDLHILSLRLPAWEARRPEFVWRGSVTGAVTDGAVEQMPRLRFACAVKGLPRVNVALMGVHETLGAFRDQIQKIIDDKGLLGARWPVHEFGRYQFAFDIDGHANAWGLLEKLILGCCVLKVESPYEQWYYPRLHAWEHYVPVAADLSDLEERIGWCRENSAQCRWIADNGQRLATTLRLHTELPRSCLELLRVATGSFEGEPISPAPSGAQAD